MFHQQYLEIINSALYKDYPLRGKKANKLMLALSYSFNLISLDDFKIWGLCHYILTKSKKLNLEIYEEFLYLMTVFYCFFASYQNNFALPCLLNQKMMNKKLSIHLVFGENVSQLASFVLISEGINIITRNIKDTKKKLSYINFFYKELSWLENRELIHQLDSLNKDLIQKHVNDLHYNFFKCAIKLTYKLLNKTIENDKVIEKLYRISFNKVNGKS